MFVDRGAKLLLIPSCINSKANQIYIRVIFLYIAVNMSCCHGKAIKDSGAMAWCCHGNALVILELWCYHGNA